MDSRKLSAILCALVILFGCFYMLPGKTEAAGQMIQDIGGPAGMTFNDVLWEKEGTGAYLVGSSSANNGEIWRWNRPNDGWNLVGPSIFGNKYNGITRTQTHFWYDDVEQGNNGWTTSVRETVSRDLVGYWKLDEGSGTMIYDSSGYKHDGTLYNANLGSCWIDGMNDKALNFDSLTDYAEVTNVANITSGSFSGDCWINFNSHTNYGGIVNKYAGSNGWGIWDQTTGEIRFYRINGGSLTYQDSSVISTGEWHYIAWVYNDISGNAHFYIDGKEDWSFPSVNPSRIISTIEIGKYSSFFLDAKIDHVRMFDRVLTPFEIENYYNRTFNKVGEWKFDEGGGTVAYDTSQHSNNGTLMNMEGTDWAGGPAETCLAFDGIDEHVNCGDKPQLNLSNEFTIEAWVYLVNNNKWQTIISKANANDAAGTSFHVRIGMTNQIQIMVSDGVGGYDAQYGSTSLQTGQWYHVAVVATGSLYHYYINGRWDGSDPQNYAPQALAAPLRIGSHAGTQYFDGAIDEVNIWNYSLSAVDILANYNRDLLNYMEIQSLPGYWKLDEGSGLTAFDSGFYRNDGTLVNMDNTDWVDGIKGKALYFDGVDGLNQVNLPTDPEFQPQDQLTLSAWVKLNETSDEPIIVGGGITYGLWVGGGRPLFRLRTTGLTDLYGNTTLQTGQWYHIAATYDGQVMRIYVNGVQDNLMGNTGTIDYSGGGFASGLNIGYYYGSGVVAHCTIDEAQIWSRNATAEEIMESYKSAFPPTWQQVDPSGLPLPASGMPHGNAKSSDNIWWFGNNATGSYDDGTRVSASLVSPPIWLPDISSVSALVFYHWFEVEPFPGPSVDKMIVSIKNTTDIGWTQLKKWDNNDAPITNWKQELIWCNFSVGNYVQLNFTFDSVDGSSNGWAGWHIDDIVIVANDMMIIVGEPGGGGYSAYTTDGFSKFDDIGGLNTVTFNDVAPGNIGATFLAVGEAGAVRYWNNSAWLSVNGAQNDETLTGVDFNGSYYFIVGYDSAGDGVAYYITEWELFSGYMNMHPFRGTQPPWKLNDVAWTNEVPTQKGKGLGAVVANGTAMSFVDPEMWFNVTRSSNPPARRWHSMVFDSQENRHIMFGGYGVSAGILGDTWVYNAGTNQWQLQTCPGGSPSARYGHAMVYVPDRNVVVMYGGAVGAAETWVYDLGNDTWTQKFPASSPGDRRYHAMTYDTDRNLVVFHGGYLGVTGQTDTWVYNISDTSEGSWTFESNTGPQVYQHSMVYDQQNHAIILFGGENAGVLDRTWVYSGGIWTEKFPGTKPVQRISPSMTYDTRLERIFMHGGNDGTNQINDLWTYDVSDGPEGTWTYFNYLRSPEAREGSQISYDHNVQRMIMFGGLMQNGDSNETWYVDFSTPWNGDVINPAIGSNGENFTAVAWDTTGYNATFVGNDWVNDTGVIYSYYIGNSHITKMPDKANTLAGHRLYGIDFKPGSSVFQDAIVSGASAFKVRPTMADQSSAIYVNVMYPHIFDIDFWEQSNPGGPLGGGPSLLNSQVDVNNDYTFYVEYNYTVGAIDAWNNVEIELTGWYDGTVAGLGSAPPDASWSAQDARTRQFNFTYDVGAGLTTPNYPLGFPGEINWLQTWEDPTIYGAPGEFRHRVYFNVTFEDQTYEAAGNGFTNLGATGGRIYDKNSALNDADSWDFCFRVYDAIQTNAANYSYEEFGINEAVSISVAGNPTANAPPGSANVVMTNPSQITYSSNVPYWVNISLVDNLLLNGVGPANIATGQIHITNGHPLATNLNSDIDPPSWPTGRPFGPPGNEWCVWGTAASLPAPLNGTVAGGPWGSDYVASIGYPGYDVTQVNWWATVPGGTQEGMYWTTITFTIEDND